MSPRPRLLRLLRRPAALAALAALPLAAAPALAERLAIGQDALVLFDTDAPGDYTAYELSTEMQEITYDPESDLLYLSTGDGLQVFTSGGENLHKFGSRVIDAVETIPGSDDVLVLIHPKVTDGAMNGPHEAVRIEAATGALKGGYALNPRAVDIKISADGRWLLSTMTVGREVTLLPLPFGRAPEGWSMAQAANGYLELPVEGAETPGMLFRFAVADPVGGGFLVLEQGKTTDNAIWRFQPETLRWESRMTFHRQEQYQAMCLSPDGRRVYLVADEALHVFDVPSRSEAAVVPLKGGAHFGGALSRDGSKMFVVSAPGPGRGAVTVVDTRKLAVENLYPVDYPTTRIALIDRGEE